jgi:low affinity Fe/Cu permease
LAIFIPVLVILLALVSILPALGAPPLPSFEDPVKVFIDIGYTTTTTTTTFYLAPELQDYFEE